MDWLQILIHSEERLYPVLRMVRARVLDAGKEGHLCVLVPVSDFNAIIPEFFDREFYVDFLKLMCEKTNLKYAAREHMINPDCVQFSWTAETVFSFYNHDK